MKRINLFSFIIVTGFLFLSGCQGFMDPSPIANTVTTPYPTAPPNNASNIYPAPAFSWSGSADRLQVSTDPDFTNIVFNIIVSSESGYCMDTGILKSGNLYFWRVGKSYGNDVAWSDAFNFTMAP